WETIDADQIGDIMSDRPPRPPKNMPPPSGDTPPGGSSGTGSGANSAGESVRVVGAKRTDDPH
ncbi:hypothetical protein, partial [Caballeronia calidae]|uniref:hypothetical protein n=1 Tax=Caballeronia calidae TaxID=1777139 RepID=UPI0012FD31B5